MIILMSSHHQARIELTTSDSEVTHCNSFAILSQHMLIGLSVKESRFGPTNTGVQFEHSIHKATNTSNYAILFNLYIYMGHSTPTPSYSDIKNAKENVWSSHISL